MRYQGGKTHQENIQIKPTRTKPTLNKTSKIHWQKSRPKQQQEQTTIMKILCTKNYSFTQMVAGGMSSKCSRSIRKRI